MEPAELQVIRPECTLQYLDEGGANVIFRIVSNDGDDLPKGLEGRLLRLRKGHSHGRTTQELFSDYERNFRDLFPKENSIQHELVCLDDRIPPLLNKALRKLQRPTNRMQDWLPEDEKHAVLITDMTAESGDVLVQLKPKWLAQSPDAPPDAKRCRTCALRAQRASQQMSTATDAQEHCPLDLVGGDVADRKRAASSITKDQPLQRYIMGDLQPLLQRLGGHQQALDRHGVLSASDDHVLADICRAMTLRDCTLYLKRSGSDVEARLGDFDLKSHQKLPGWRDVEQSLIDHGWYTNKEDQNVWSKEKTCSLSR